MEPAARFRPGYAFGLGPDEALNQINVAANTRATLIPDVIGSIVGLLDSGGALTKFGYQTFGENPSLTSGGYRYTRHRLDQETVGSSTQASGLYYYCAADPQRERTVIPKVMTADRCGPNLACRWM
jgi:hypothetical protein